MGTDGEREEGESDGEHLRGYHRHHLEIGAASYDEERGAAAMALHLGGMPPRAPSAGALLDFNEQFRSPMSDDWAAQPRKARWNRKVS